MSTPVSWPVIGGTSYSVPAASEVNWPALSNYLIALAGAQSVTNQKVAIRTATSTPVTVVSASDCIVVTNLSVAGAVAVNLPAGVAGQIFTIVDGKGDAGTNNITITPNGAETINGAATYVITVNRAGVSMIFSGTNWSVYSEFQNLSSGTSTGTGALVRQTSPTINTPTIGTSLTGPKIIGGTGTGSTLTLQSTSGIGATDQILFTVGNNGATSGGSISTAGAWTLGPTGFTGTHTYNTVIQKQIGKDTTSAVYGYIQNSDNSKSAYLGLNNSTGTAIINSSDASALCIASNTGIAFSGDNSANHGNMSTAGAWTFGGVSATTTHLFRSGGVTTLKATTAANNDVALNLNRTVNTASDWKIYLPSGSTDFRLYNGSADVGIVTSAGAWTIGPASGNVNHLIKSNAVNQLDIDQNGAKVRGRADGAAPAAGYLGEVQETSWSGQTINIGGGTTLASAFSVSAGIYLVTIGDYGNKGGATVIQGSIVANTATISISLGDQGYFQNTVDGGASWSSAYYMRVTVAGTIDVKATATTASASSHAGRIQLVRVG
jgi:hypothetical protein